MNSTPRKSVVIVDDDIAYTKLLTQLLGDHLDCPVAAFSQPREALTALPRLNAGVIVTDYEMPELNGFEFMTEAAKLAPAASFILITGHPINDTMQSLVAASPVKAVLPKPFSWRMLADEIIRNWPSDASRSPLKADSASTE